MCASARVCRRLTADAEAVGRRRGLDLLGDGVVGGALVGPGVVLRGVGDLQVPRRHDEVVPWGTRTTTTNPLIVWALIY